MEVKITFCGQTAIHFCDGKCNKAWGMSSRPRVPLSCDEDDFEYLSDDELDEAPEDPETYEGGYAKPMFPWEPNKWCVRECERASLNRPEEPIKKPDFTKRVQN